MAHDAKSPALYLRCASRAAVELAASGGATGISLEVRRDDAGAVLVSDDSLASLLHVAQGLGLAVELVAGQPLDSRPATSLIAGIVAELVSGQLALDTIQLSSFDHLAVSTIGRSVDGLAVGLRHLVTLHGGEHYALAAGAAALHPVAGAVTPREVELASALGITMHAWTLVAEFWPGDERSQLANARAAGVDAVTVSDARLLPAGDAR